MTAIQSFDFNPARLDGSFSDMQPVSDSVQRAESTTPGCCGRTRVTISCRAFERDYSLELPLKSRKPNESPSQPPENFTSHVMSSPLAPPVLQVLSEHDGGAVAQVNVTAAGPPQCPPGIPNRLRLEGVGGGMREVPQDAWVWLAPAILDASLIEDLDEDFISLLHPFKMPDLPAQTWKLELPKCPASRLQASIAAFPDIRWQGQLEISSRPKKDGTPGCEMRVEGDLSCTYNGRRWVLDTHAQAKSLCVWVECLEMLARAASSVMTLKPAARHAGLEHPVLRRLEPFRFEPWPKLGVSVDASLYEQEGNGLLGHALRFIVQGDPLIGASGELGLLGPWLEQLDKKPLMEPLLAGLDVVRVEEIAQEIGIWLVADGHLKLRAGVEARRPDARTASLGRASGGIHLGVEPRSVRDYDSFVTHQSSATESDKRAGFFAGCESPPETPSDDPREHKPKAAVLFTGLQVHSIVKSRPGCHFYHHAADDEKNASTEQKGASLLPARFWPGDATLETPVEVPWCE